MNWEAKARQHLAAHNWQVYQHGWPDLAITRNDELVFVEVKSPTTNNDAGKLSQAQTKLLGLLDKHGIKCYVWRMDRLMRVKQNGSLVKAEWDELGLDEPFYNGKTTHTKRRRKRTISASEMARRARLYS